MPAADLAARNRLVALGYTVTTVDDNLTVPGDATGKQLLVISSTTSSANVNTKYRTTAVPVVVWETALFDDFGMTAAGGTFVAGQQNIVIAAPGNPMAAGLTGTVTVSSVAGELGQGSPGPNATIIARLPGATTASTFAYDTGVAMPGLAAPARRVALYLGDTTAATFTAGGGALFDAAINWAAGTAQGAAAPTGGALATLPTDDDLGMFGRSSDGPRGPVPNRSWPLPATIPDGVQVKRPATLARARLFRSRRAGSSR
jgi:hypothetical protein